VNASNVARGTIYIALMNATDALIGFVFYFGLARILPPSDVGLVSMMFFIVAAFNTFTLLALNSAVIKYVAQFMGANSVAEASAVVRKVLKLLLVVSLPAFVLLVILSPWLSQVLFGGGLSSTVLLVTFLSALLLDFINYFGAIMYGLGLFDGVVVQNIGYYALSRFPALLLAFVGLGVLGVAYGLAIGASASVIYSIIRLKGRLPLSRQDFPLRRLLSFSLPLYASSILILGQGWIDVLLLYTITGNPTSVGIYYLVIGGISVVSMVWTPVTLTLFPAISHRYGEAGLEGIKRPVSSTLRFLTVIVVPVSVSLAAVASTALRVAYGSAYIQGAVALAVLAVSAVFSAYWGVLSGVLQVLEKTFQVLLIGVIAILTNALVIASTAGTLGSVGAALGRASMAPITVLMALIILRKTPLDLSIGRDLGARVLALSFMLGLPLLVLDNSLRASNLTSIAVATADFLVFLLLGSVGLKFLKPLKSEDLAVVNAVLPGRLRTIVRVLM
jgi:O-antigen/teichoic acid export membrane protein